MLFLYEFINLHNNDLVANTFHSFHVVQLTVILPIIPKTQHCPSCSDVASDTVILACQFLFHILDEMFVTSLKSAFSSKDVSKCNTEGQRKFLL